MLNVDRKETERSPIRLVDSGEDRKKYCHTILFLHILLQSRRLRRSTISLLKSFKIHWDNLVGGVKMRILYFRLIEMAKSKLRFGWDLPATTDSGVQYQIYTTHVRYKCQINLQKFSSFISRAQKESTK